MVSGRTKEFQEALLKTAHDLVNQAGGVGALDGLQGEAHGRALRLLYRQLREQGGVSQSTARQYIAKALRRERYKATQNPASMDEYRAKWGGARAGAGAKTKTPDKFASWTTTDYDQVSYYLIAIAPSRKELDQRVESYFEKPNQFALFERSNERRGTMRQFEVALAKQQKYIFQLKNNKK